MISLTHFMSVVNFYALLISITKCSKLSVFNIYMWVCNTMKLMPHTYWWLWSRWSLLMKVKSAFVFLFWWSLPDDFVIFCSKIPLKNNKGISSAPSTACHVFNRHSSLCMQVDVLSICSLFCLSRPLSKCFCYLYITYTLCFLTFFFLCTPISISTFNSPLH